MSGRVPLPVVNGKDELPKEAKILSIADLEVEGSKKLPRLARGKFRALSGINFVSIESYYVNVDEVSSHVYPSSHSAMWPAT